MRVACQANERWLPETKELIVSYRATYWRLKRTLKKCIEQAGAEGAHPDEKLLRAAISDVHYVIQWLHTGRQPGNRRGIERRAAYQREKLMDPVMMQTFVVQSSAGSRVNLSDYERYVIEDALSILSNRERECYLMTHGKGHSFAHTAETLGISKGAVQEYVERAQAKVTAEVNTKLRIVFRDQNSDRRP